MLTKDFYLNIDEAKVIISGDGVPWIRECQKYWPGSIYVLDKFHAIRKIRNVYSPNSSKFTTNLSSIENQSYQDNLGCNVE